MAVNEFGWDEDAGDLEVQFIITPNEYTGVVDPATEEHAEHCEGNPKAVVFRLVDGSYYACPPDDMCYHEAVREGTHHLRYVRSHPEEFGL